MRTPPLVVLVAEQIVRAEYARQFRALEARLAEIRRETGK